MSAWEFFHHESREIAGNRLIFACLYKCFLHTIYLELSGVRSAIKILHGRERDG